MSRLRQAVMWVGLLFIILLILLSIFGAFIGPQRAKELFNTVPLTSYWLFFAALLFVAIVIFPRLIRVPSLLLIHLACILILAGGLIGSEKGHQICKQTFGIDKISSGKMIIYLDGADNQVLLTQAAWPDGLSYSVGQTGRTEYYVPSGDEQFNKVVDDSRIKQLPFDVRLTEFRTEYYSPATLYVRTRQRGYWKLPAELGAEFVLAPDVGSITVLKTFENCKIRTEQGRVQAFEAPGPGSNPALQLRVTYPDGSQVDRFVFERFPGHGHTDDEFTFSYNRTVKDWISSLQILKSGRVIASKDIELNHPMHFGGYSFYQHFYDTEHNRYTVLLVASDTGLNFVWAGFLMLNIGVFWHFWLRPLLKSNRKASPVRLGKGRRNAD
jgi:hypothetical protein